MLRHLAPATVLDVGANKGQFTLVVRAVAPKANVLAFEPLASEAATFKRNHGRDPLVTLYPFALSDRSGTATFHVTNRADSSSLLMPAANAKKAYEVSTTHAISVDVGRLDELVGVDALVPPVLLKLDVQGAEAMVLEGATGLLDKIDYVFTEVSFVPLYEGQALASDILKLIHSRGYALRGGLQPFPDESLRSDAGKSSLREERLREIYAHETCLALATDLSFGCERSDAGTHECFPIANPAHEKQRR